MSDDASSDPVSEDHDTAADAATTSVGTTDPAASPRQRRRLPTWLLPLLIGAVTVTAGLFTWRAGQLGSTAAFEDRQSVGQTIQQQHQTIDARLGAVGDAVSYVNYAADYEEALAFDDLAAEMDDKGFGRAAEGFRSDAAELRSNATSTAVASGVFGLQTVLTQTVASPTEPLPFDLDRHIETLQAQAETGLTSPGVLEPEKWAEMADDTRSRVRGLRLSTLVLLMAVIAYTVGQLTERRLTRRLGAGIGSCIFVVTTIITVVSVY